MNMGGPRRSQQGQRKEPRKIITSMSLSNDVQLNKAEKAWKPGVKKAARGGGRGAEPDEVGGEAEDPEHLKTQELFKRVRSVLNKLTPQMFQQLMKQVTELKIDTEERLKGVIDLIFEKAISEPNFSVAYANMCRCLLGVRGCHLFIPHKHLLASASVNFCFIGQRAGWHPQLINVWGKYVANRFYFQVIFIFLDRPIELSLYCSVHLQIRILECDMVTWGKTNTSC